MAAPFPHDHIAAAIGLFFQAPGLKKTGDVGSLSACRLKKSMKIAMLASEIAPFAKTGGLADVLGTLHCALGKARARGPLIMPAYRCVLNGPFAWKRPRCHWLFPLGESDGRALTSQGSSWGKTCPYTWCAPTVTLTATFFTEHRVWDYPDNVERFVFFSRAALEILRNTQSRSSIATTGRRRWGSSS